MNPFHPSNPPNFQQLLPVTRHTAPNASGAQPANQQNAMPPRYRELTFNNDSRLEPDFYGNNDPPQPNYVVPDHRAAQSSDGLVRPSGNSSTNRGLPDSSAGVLQTTYNPEENLRIVHASLLPDSTNITTTSTFQKITLAAQLILAPKRNDIRYGLRLVANCENPKKLTEIISSMKSNVKGTETCLRSAVWYRLCTTVHGIDVCPEASALSLLNLPIGNLAKQFLAGIAKNLPKVWPADLEEYREDCVNAFGVWLSKLTLDFKEEHANAIATIEQKVLQYSRQGRVTSTVSNVNEGPEQLHTFPLPPKKRKLDNAPPQRSEISKKPQRSDESEFDRPARRPIASHPDGGMASTPGKYTVPTSAQIAREYVFTAPPGRKKIDEMNKKLPEGFVQDDDPWGWNSHNEEIVPDEEYSTVSTQTNHNLSGPPLSPSNYDWPSQKFEGDVPLNVGNHSSHHNWAFTNESFGDGVPYDDSDADSTGATYFHRQQWIPSNATNQVQGPGQYPQFQQVPSNIPLGQATQYTRNISAPAQPPDLNTLTFELSSYIGSNDLAGIEATLSKLTDDDQVKLLRSVLRPIGDKLGAAMRSGSGEGILIYGTFLSKMKYLAEEIIKLLKRAPSDGPSALRVLLMSGKKEAIIAFREVLNLCNLTAEQISALLGAAN
jgi:hypothetical protein